MTLYGCDATLTWKVAEGMADEQRFNASKIHGHNAQVSGPVSGHFIQAGGDVHVTNGVQGVRGVHHDFEAAKTAVFCQLPSVCCKVYLPWSRFCVFFTGIASVKEFVSSETVTKTALSGKLITVAKPIDPAPFQLFAFLFLLGAVCWVLVIWFRKRVGSFPKSRLLSRWLPARYGITDIEGRGRLALVRYTGTCSICGGRLRFYSKVVERRDIEHLRDDGTKYVTSEIVKRVPVAECSRNPDNVAVIDITDHSRLTDPRIRR